MGNLSDADVSEFIKITVPEDKKNELATHKQVDYAYQTEDGLRLRCNAFIQQESHAMAVRILNNSDCTIESLGLPEVLYEICKLNSGLVLVTGPTGSGKSTTLASHTNN